MTPTSRRAVLPVAGLGLLLVVLALRPAVAQERADDPEGGESAARAEGEGDATLGPAPEAAPDLPADAPAGPSHAPPGPSERELTRRQILRTLAAAEVVIVDDGGASGWRFRRDPRAPTGAWVEGTVVPAWGCGVAPGSSLPLRLGWHTELPRLQTTRSERLLVAGRIDGGEVTATFIALWDGRSVLLGWPYPEAPVSREDLLASCADPQGEL